jgi:hypothetical protein
MCAINVFDDQPIVGSNSPLFATEATCPSKKNWSTGQIRPA